MKRSSRPVVTVLAMALVSGGLAVAGAAPASAATGPVLGSVTVNPLAGTDGTVIGVSVADPQCPAGTDEAGFDIKGADIGELGDETVAGSGDVGNLGAGTPSGPQSGGGSIANLKSTNTGAFSSSGAYRIRFKCISGADILATYESTMNYTAGNPGSYTIAAPPVAARATATTLSANPAGPFEVGTLTNLTADVTPTTGGDDATGSVQFYNGATSLGIDNTLTGTGVATLADVSLPVGTNDLTAVYTPADSAFTGSTSPVVPVTVTAVAPRPTSSVLTVNPTSGNAYQTVSLTCLVDDSPAGAFAPNGSATFFDGTTSLGSAPVVSGAPAVLAGSFSTPGAHSFSCSFVGAAPYTNSTSNAVAASYVNVGADPDEQTVTVVIPQGALTITTPYTPAAPLSLGTALLDQNNATYSASAQFGTGAGDPDGAGPLTNSYIQITDTRAGNLGWTASLSATPFSNGGATVNDSFSSSYAGLTGLVKVPVPSNALNVAAVTTADNPPNAAGGLSTIKQFASYPAGQSIGTAWLYGTFSIDDVPTSVSPGTYTSTVTFTAA